MHRHSDRPKPGLMSAEGRKQHVVEIYIDTAPDANGILYMREPSHPAIAPPDA
jgi:hypothetical protein